MEVIELANWIKQTIEKINSNTMPLRIAIYIVIAMVLFVVGYGIGRFFGEIVFS